MSLIVLVTARRASFPWTKLATALGLTAILIGPACWSLSTAITPGVGMMPAANPTGLTGGREHQQFDASHAAVRRGDGAK